MESRLECPLKPDRVVPSEKGTFSAPKTQRVAMMNAARCVCMCSVLHVPMHRIEFFRLQVWDAHTQAWDGRPKALYGHQQPANGEFCMLIIDNSSLLYRRFQSALCDSALCCASS